MDKLNLFNPAQGMQAIQPTKAVGGQPTESSSGSSSNKNPFGGQTVGLNTNIGVGDTMNIAAQAGKKAGIGKTLGFA